MQLKDILPHRAPEIDKIYERTIAIRFKLAITLIGLNSGGVITMLQLIYKTSEITSLAKFPSLASVFFITGIFFGIFSLWKLIKIEGLNWSNFEIESLIKVAEALIEKTAPKEDKTTYQFATRAKKTAENAIEKTIPEEIIQTKKCNDRLLFTSLLSFAIGGFIPLIPFLIG